MIVPTLRTKDHTLHVFPTEFVVTTADCKTEIETFPLTTTDRKQITEFIGGQD